MNSTNLSREQIIKLIETIKAVYDFAVDFNAAPMTIMHLYQAMMHLERHIEPHANSALRMRTYDDFVINILAKKPYPINSNTQQKGN